MNIRYPLRGSLSNTYNKITTKEQTKNVILWHG